MSAIANSLPVTRRLLLGAAGEVECVLDAEDYEWATRWRWGITYNQARTKLYATRSTRLHGRKGPQTRIYLHKAILVRAGAVPPTDAHTIGDHMDGDSLNNTRLNLRWATVEQNNRNRFGSFLRQPALHLVDEVPF